MIATFEVQKKKRNFGGFFFVVENFVVRSLAGHVPAGAGRAAICDAILRRGSWCIWGLFFCVWHR